MSWLILSLAYPVALGFVLALIEGGVFKQPRFEGDKIIYRS